MSSELSCGGRSWYAVGMTRVEEIVEQVRALPPDEQEVVRMLLNLGSEDDFELSPEWQAEIRERVEELEQGDVKGIPWDEVDKKLERRLHGGSWD